MPRFLVLSNARSGSTLLCSLLKCHWKIELAGELLNDEICKGCTDPLAFVEEQLSLRKSSFVGFKLFPEQIFEIGLRFDDIIRHINAKYVIVLWRESIVETLVSRRIAEKTKTWYSTMESITVEKIAIQPKDLELYINVCQREWKIIGTQWPVDVIPIFVKYEDLVADPIKEMKRILEKMSLEISDLLFRIDSKRQNPASLPEKVSNWNHLTEELKTATICVPSILTEAINATLAVANDCLWVVPDREPPIPANGWTYRVSEPFTCDKIKQNVITALYSNSVSSAGFWPQELSSKLKKVFGLPVAQPCCNGFMSLVLALQASCIGKGHEVILPSMTMIAVANAVKFLNGTPVFVDTKLNNYNPGWSEIQSAISEKTKVVILTHTFGVPTPDLEMIVEECKKRKLVLIEDISECVGIAIKTSNGVRKLLGTFGDFACASLYANKIIHAGDGGFVLAKNPRLHSNFLSLVNHGFTPSYHFLHFESSVNGKINGLGAAMACGCIDQMDDILNHRSEIAQTYRVGLQSTPLKLTPECGDGDTPWVFGVECESKQQRCELRAFMAKKGIESRDFFFPMHLQPAFSYLKSDLKFTNSERCASHGFYLPTHPNLSKADVEFICDVIQAFFQSSHQLMKPPAKETMESMLINPGCLRLETLSFNNSNGIKSCDDRRTNLLTAVEITLEADYHLRNERWDDRERILHDINECISKADAKNGAVIKKHFQPYINYLTTQKHFEPQLLQPWLSVNLNLPIYNEANRIPTTTCYESRQMLCWLVKEMKLRTILEIGCLFGHSTLLMAATALGLPSDQDPVIYSCDAFRWKSWMEKFVSNTNFQNGESFKSTFEENILQFKHWIKPVTWSFHSKSLPKDLQNVSPDLVFIDFTQEDEELETIWKVLYPLLTPNKTIIVFNGLSWRSISFLANHADEMEPIIQPCKTLSKAFLLKSKNVKVAKEQILEFSRKLDFQPSPDWHHHQQNAFSAIIETLKLDLHCENSSMMFTPSVEEYLGQNADIQILKPWIGIIHGVPDNKNDFYVPDLRHLCSVDNVDKLKHCKGLFTLTKFQMKFLQENWPKELMKVPIHQLTYPFLPPSLLLTSRILENWRNNGMIELVSVGSFARDFNLFFKMKVPKDVQKVLLMGDEPAYAAAKNASKDVVLCDRLSKENYEQMLQTSIIFLSLLYDGAANTVVLECIARNVPIVCPSFSSCIEYLGEGYPLFYDPHGCLMDLTTLITKENIKGAIEYLEKMDKTKFSVDYFINEIKSSAVLFSVPPIQNTSGLNHLHYPIDCLTKYDVTISICSYKRTHNLSTILKRLWDDQDFSGTIEIVVWNNNEARKDQVSKICDFYVRSSSIRKCLHLINSTNNYFAQIRFAMPALMKSDYLLVCDDDIIPESSFIRFFMEANQRHGNEVLCLRGHKFLPHSLNLTKPTKVWHQYHKLRFVDDNAESQIIHFAHADACLIPKNILQECASIDMPDPGFALVDDYWLSFILSHKFGRKIRKLNLADCPNVPFQRSDDSDMEGLAMHTRPEVQDARIRLYIYHMTQGWPTWPKIAAQLKPEEASEIAISKKQFWNVPSIGINVSSKLTDNDIEALMKLGIQYVRIGAVGVGKIKNFEFSEFLQDPETQMEKLVKLIQKLACSNIRVIITLDARIASPRFWKLIAEQCRQFSAVVGYDLINEPFTVKEDGISLSDLPNLDDDYSKILDLYKFMVAAIREVDSTTPIIVEPTFWAHIDALFKLNINSASDIDPLLIFSVHFYEPNMLVRRRKNRGRYQFPGDVPVFDNTNSELVFWDDEKIKSQIYKAVRWGTERNIKVFVGEFGICRDIGGADKYLRSVANACKNFNISTTLYGFRDKDWDAMDYELGTERSTGRRVIPWHDNPLMKAICDFVATYNQL